MDCAVYGFSESAPFAAAFAAELGVPFFDVAVRRFPDGESLVRVEPAGRIAILYRSLDDPNSKLVELLLAASALRDNGALRVILIAPYLAYMRQDMAFHSGEAVSQRAIGTLLQSWFDAVLSVDPHLHRVASLHEIMPAIPARSISAAPALSAALAGMDAPILVGPDSESRQWVEAIAAPLSLDVLVGEKTRNGDRDVAIEIPGIEKVAGRHAVLVDDVISSGQTLAVAAQLLKRAGAGQIEALATHCLAHDADLARLAQSGIAQVRSAQTVPGPTATIGIASLLAGEIAAQGWLGKVWNYNE